MLEMILGILLSDEYLECLLYDSVGHFTYEGKSWMVDENLDKNLARFYYIAKVMFVDLSFNRTFPK